MRDPAVHWPPSSETRSLSATGTPSSGRSWSSARSGSVRDAASRASAASASESARSRSIVSQALSARLSRSAASRWAVVRSRDETSPRRRSAAISWPWSRVRSVIGPSALVEDGGDHDEVALALGRVRQNRLDGERWLDDIVAEDVLELDGLRGGRDVVGRQLGEDRVLVEDVVELPFQPRQLGVAQAESGEIGDVLDIGSAERGPCLGDNRTAR